jgi:curli production assembly/transport component CsgE
VNTRKNILLLLLFVSNTILGQTDSIFVAWLEPQVFEDREVVACWFQNNSVAPVSIRYRAVLTEGDSLEVREGSSIALPRQPTLLLKAIFVVTLKDYESISLDILRDDRVIAAAVYRNTTLANQLSPERTDSPLTLAGSNIPSLDDLEIEGLILDETRSKLAHDFYELFYTTWTQEDSTANLSVMIRFREMPARAGLGARIAVDLDDEEFSQFNLQPGGGLLENLAAQLAALIRNQIENPQEEIQTDELQGSGVY